MRTLDFVVRMSCIAALFVVGLSAQAPDPPRAQWSPVVRRVLATCDEIDNETVAVMAGGGTATPRINAVEARLAVEVNDAGPELLDVLRAGDYETAHAAACALGYFPNAATAVDALLAALARFDGRLTNNIGISLERLSRQHPELAIPLEPLVAALDAHDEWNRQQKIAQVIEALLEHRPLPDSKGALAAALIPMLANQRIRVSGAAREILPRITGQSLGKKPEPWCAWYLRKYGRRVDVAAGVYELAQVVHLELRNGPAIYRVEGRRYTTEEALLARLRIDAETTHAIGRKFGVVLVVPESGFPEERLTSLAEAALAISRYNVVMSPESDEFVPFSTALKNLRRLSVR
jgi:hypothetical protein